MTQAAFCGFVYKEGIINTDQVKGVPKDAAGGVRERFDELMVSPEQKARGIAKQVEGFAQKKAGDLKEAIQEAVKNKLQEL